MADALSVDGLTKRYPGRGRTPFVAVDDISFNINSGETLALVGESGCGKTTTGRMIVGLEKASAGTISVAGVETTAGRRALSAARGHMQMVFQDPYESIDSRMRILEAVREPLLGDRALPRSHKDARAKEMLDLVGLEPATYAERFPYELSGGQRQRVAIARAMVAKPTLVVADEPVSMLDVSIRATVLDLFRRIQDVTGVSYLFITHDLMVAQHVSHRIAVMRAGKILEIGETPDVMNNPRDVYTRELLAAAPRLP